MADEVKGVDPQSVQQATQVIAQNLKQLEAYRAELRKVAEVEREVDEALGRVTKSQAKRSKTLADLEDQIEKGDFPKNMYGLKEYVCNKMCGQSKRQQYDMHQSFKEKL